MLVITNGVDTLTVTKGAFNALYKYQGFIVAEEGAEAPSPSGETDTVASTQADDTVQAEEPDEEYSDEEGDTTDGTDEEPDLSEIPLIEMNKEQLIRYADQVGVEYTGAETKKELRAAIRKALS